jgi:DNA-binding transcriptional LysR family regulator
MPRPPVTTLSIHLAIRLVATGRFVAKELPLRVLPIKLPVQHRTVGTITLKNRTLSPVAELFINCARAAVRSGSGDPMQRPRLRTPLWRSFQRRCC